MFPVPCGSDGWVGFVIVMWMRSWKGMGRNAPVGHLVIVAGTIIGIVFTGFSPWELLFMANIPSAEVRKPSSYQGSQRQGLCMVCTIVKFHCTSSSFSVLVATRCSECALRTSGEHTSAASAACHVATEPHSSQGLAGTSTMRSNVIP